MRAQGGSEETLEKNVASGRSEGKCLKSVQDKSSALRDGPGIDHAACQLSWISEGGVRGGRLELGENVRVTLTTAKFLSKIADPFPRNTVFVKRQRSKLFLLLQHMTGFLS